MMAADIPVGDHRNLLDIIDNLRAQGFSRYIDLPEIIVCGDQAAGKSSVLEAISGMKFPTKDGLCTRFATELVLRRGHVTNTKVFITPGQDRYDEWKKKIESWQPQNNLDIDGLEAVTKEAMEAMDIPVPRKFYDDILRIEVTGPKQPHLTMVDLPGLFRAGNKEQSDADVATVRSMVEKYMARPRSIILAVVSAKNEYVLQEVTSMAKYADPEGLRTMGLITKPDTLDVGSDSEGYWVRLAQNTEVELRLGWHVLRNRNFEQRGSTSAQRDDIERRFFSSGIWSSVDPLHCGVEALRNRLSSVLTNQILSQLPSLVQDVETGIRQCTEQLDRIGPVRKTREQQQKYLLHVSEGFTSLTEQSIDGAYMDRFFGDRKERNGYPRKLRAVVQNRLLEFRQEMLLNGQSQTIIDSESEGENENELSESPRISRSQYVEQVASHLKFSRGRELQGLFNPVIVGDLFVAQSEPWRKITEQLVEDIVNFAHHATQLVIQHVAASDVAAELRKFVHEKIDQLKVGLDAKVKELLASAKQHPITYNQQLTNNVQNIQHARYKRNIRQLLRTMFGSQPFDDEDKKIYINPVQLVEDLAHGLETDMELSGSFMAVDYMEAYYKVAMNRFIDDVSVLAIEDCLIAKVSKLFRSTEVLTLSNEDVSRLAGETRKCSVERKRLEEKHKILDAGLRGLKGLQRQRPFHRPAEWDPTPRGTLESRPSTVAPSSEEASIAASVIESSPMMKYQGAADPPFDEDFEPSVKPKDEEWEVEDTQVPQEEKWDFPAPSFKPSRKVRRVKRLLKDIFQEPSSDQDPEQ